MYFICPFPLHGSQRHSLARWIVLPRVVAHRENRQHGRTFFASASLGKRRTWEGLRVDRTFSNSIRRKTGERLVCPRFSGKLVDLAPQCPSVWLSRREFPVEVFRDN